jgi:large subunit ribosomal protein L22
MGERKRNSAEQRKEQRKTIYMARLNNCPTSPRKMRLVADQIRGISVETALHILKTSPKEASGRLHKLLLSAISNWQSKNEGKRIEDANLFVKSINVDSGRMLKRVQPAPQGRAHRVRKRSNHVTLMVDSWMEPEEIQAQEEQEETAEAAEDKVQEPEVPEEAEEEEEEGQEEKQEEEK